MTRPDRTQISKRLYQMYQGKPDDGSERTRPWWGLFIGTGIPGAQNAIITEDENAHVDYTAYRSASEAREAFERIVAEVHRGMWRQDNGRRYGGVIRCGV